MPSSSSSSSAQFRAWKGGGKEFESGGDDVYSNSANSRILEERQEVEIRGGGEREEVKWRVQLKTGMRDKATLGRKEGGTRLDNEGAEETFAKSLRRRP